MPEPNITCEVCGERFYIEGYDDGDCPRCGVAYLYEEGKAMALGPVVRFDLAKGEVTFKIKREPPTQDGDDSA